MMRLTGSVASLALIVALAPPLYSQETQATEAEAAAATTDEDAPAQGELLTEAELDKLMGPIALFPDTLLIQVLVAATYPLEVIKGDQFLDETELEGDELIAAIEAEEWDASVEVLATAFPDVIAAMADHVDWTETVGEAMMVQTDDVQTSIQRLRDQAIQTGALVSNDAQVVEEVEDEVVITPADPQVVYVPEYEADQVYVQDSTNDALTTGLVLFGSAILINEIFDDDDDWYGYWGCRSCAGWGGRPIIRNPDIDIDIDGDVNIGDRIDRDEIGWTPEPERRDEAKERISERRDSGERDNRGDELREKLSTETGARDISRDGAGAAAAAVAAGAAAGAVGTGVARDKVRQAAPKAGDKAARPKPSGDRAKAAAPKARAKPVRQVERPRSIQTQAGRGGAAKNRARTPGGRRR